MGRVLRFQRRVRRTSSASSGPTSAGPPPGTGGRGPRVGAQFGLEAADLGAEFRRVVRAERPDPLRVVELVQGDGGGRECWVSASASQASCAAPSIRRTRCRPKSSERVAYGGSLTPAVRSRSRRLGERLVRLLQLVVGLQGLRDDDPRGRVPGGRRADAVDDRAGLRLVAVLPEVRGLQSADEGGCSSGSSEDSRRS